MILDEIKNFVRENASKMREYYRVYHEIFREKRLAEMILPSIPCILKSWRGEIRGISNGKSVYFQFKEGLPQNGTIYITSWDERVSKAGNPYIVAKMWTIEDVGEKMRKSMEEKMKKLHNTGFRVIAYEEMVRKARGRLFFEKVRNYFDPSFLLVLSKNPDLISSFALTLKVTIYKARMKYTQSSSKENTWVHLKDENKSRPGMIAFDYWVMIPDTDDPETVVDNAIVTTNDVLNDESLYVQKVGESA